MAISCVHFQKASLHAEKHNFREDKKAISYLLPEQFREKNDAKLFMDARLSYDSEVAKLGKKAGKRPKFENSIFECTINLNKEHTVEDAERAARKIADMLNFELCSIAVHRDEGHIERDSNGKEFAIHNYHAHVLFQTFKDGKQNVRRENVGTKFRDIQTAVAETLGMKRGEINSERKHLSHKAYRAHIREIDSVKNDLVDKLHVMYQSGEIITKQQLNRYLDKQKSELRQQFIKEQSHTAEDYKKLNETFNKLKEQLQRYIKGGTVTTENFSEYLKMALDAIDNLSDERDAQLEDNKQMHSDLTVEKMRTRHYEDTIQRLNTQFGLFKNDKKIELEHKDKELKEKDEQLKQKETELTEKNKQIEEQAQQLQSKDLSIKNFEKKVSELSNELTAKEQKLREPLPQLAEDELKKRVQALPKDEVYLLRNDLWTELKQVERQATLSTSKIQKELQKKDEIIDYYKESNKELKTTHAAELKQLNNEIGKLKKQNSSLIRLLARFKAFVKKKIKKLTERPKATQSITAYAAAQTELTQRPPVIAERNISDFNEISQKPRKPHIRR